MKLKPTITAEVSSGSGIGGVNVPQPKNVITIGLVKDRVVHASGLYQYDYGQRFLFTGTTLPEHYEVHFANGNDGESVTMIGDATGVDVPDEVLLSGKPVYFWVFLHEGDADGETEYPGMVQVAKRAKPSDEEPTPVQQDAITTAIAALNEGVEEVRETVAGVEEKIDTELQKAKDSGDFDGADGFSPTVDVEKISGGHQVTITDAEGQHPFDVMDGVGEDIIHDDAGAGDTDKVWSADKVVSELAGKYAKPVNGIPDTDLSDGVQTSLGKANSAYQKPNGGIPAEDIAAGVIPAATEFATDSEIEDIITDWGSGT